MRKPTVRMSILGLLVVAVLVSPSAFASTTAVGLSAFGPGSTLSTFAGLTTGTEVNGLIVDGIRYTYSLGNGQVIIDAGPGITNNITPPNVVSIANDSGVLELLLPSLVDTFGYGYAILNTSPSVIGATTISLFNGSTALGSLSYDAAPDPLFDGGFAGIHSDVAFNRVDLSFNSAAAPAFALDNVRTATNNVPEPASLSLLLIGMAGLGFRLRKGIA